ncbi:phosphoribosyltransferase [Leptolyngbya sp. GB1-A1]|uniref:phosphoribosyltransferase n=2 Tax=Leptolyngbya TaxID=47251 RepID=UPI0019A92E7C|nr:phosphoribosyltransferase [Cyanobacteria bacterium FACHB-502]
MRQPFQDRREAGQQLATQLTDYADRLDVIVLGLPRGGVPIAYEISATLHVPLDVCLVRKLGVPGQKELAMGAIAPGDVMVLNRDVIRSLQITQAALDTVTAEEQQELNRRDRAYRGDRAFPDLRKHTVILVDDGIATGSTIRAAIATIRAAEAQAIVVAVPIAPAEVVKSLAAIVDRVVCLLMPEPLHSIGQWYENFDQTSDEEVRDLLRRGNAVSSAG